MADTTTKVLRAASWPRERFYFSNDQRRSAGVVPCSWDADEPVADRERWKIRKVTHHGFKATLRANRIGWTTEREHIVLTLTEACRIAREWVRSQEGEGR